MKGSKPGPKKHKVCSECGEVIKEGRTMCSNYCMGGRGVEVQDNGKTFVCSKCGGAWPSDRDWCRNFCSDSEKIPVKTLAQKDFKLTSSVFKACSACYQRLKQDDLYCSKCG